MFNLKPIELTLILQILGLGNVICVLHLIFSVDPRNQYVRVNLVNVSHSRDSLYSISHQGMNGKGGDCIIILFYITCYGRIVATL